ncbi:MAG: hypothetical protein R3E39_09455 [Anaerolineae bacterium]
MKKHHLTKYHFLTLVSAVLLFAVIFPTADTRGSAIILDDNNPIVSMQVELPTDATGVVALRLAQAAVHLQDAHGNTVFQSEDGRVHGLELNVSPNSSTHLVTVGRLSGTAEAAVDIHAQPDMTGISESELVEGDTLALNQRRILSVDGTNQVTIQIPEGTLGAISARYEGADVGISLHDEDGDAIMEAGGGDIDGLHIVLSGGEYRMTLAGENIPAVDVSVSVVDDTRDQLLALPVVNANEQP